MFPQHPVVKVVENANEMVISDYYTDEFIAKKIFYNDTTKSNGASPSSEHADQNSQPDQTNSNRCAL